MKPGESGVRTGDINFAAACMSMGVPLDQREPCSVTLREGRPDYGSWHLMTRTADGKDAVSDLSKMWSNPATAPAAHPFTLLMRFIKARPVGCSSPADWLDHAHAWTAANGIRTPDAPRSMDEVPDFIRRKPDHVSAYVFAFPYNRRTCLEQYNAAIPDVFMQRGGRSTIISTKLDARLAGELLARLKA